MIIKEGNAFNTHEPAPHFIVVSVYDVHPPGIEWTKSTSLKAFSKLIMMKVTSRKSREHGSTC